MNTIIYLIILILFSGFFSASETAFSSLNKIRLKYLANEGNKKAAKTLELAEEFNKVLNTVLVGNNIVNIVSTSLATLLFISLFENNGALYSSITMTVIVLIFGEIVPKTLAKNRPEKFAMAITPLISFFIVILSPITLITNALADFISSLFKNEENEDFTSEEFITMVEEAKEEGDMEKEEADLITNAIEFNDQDVGKVFTPRVDVCACDIKENLEKIDSLFRESGYSRLPIYDGSVDNIVGVLHEKDFYFEFYKNGNHNIKRLLSKPLYTSEHVKISALLKQLKKAKSHMAVVLDEYGGTAGIITMEDILEEIVGEIYDEHDEVVEYFKKIDDNTTYVNCDVDIEDMFEYFDIDEDEEYDFNTVSGFVIHSLDRIPVKHDSFDYKNLHIEVTDCDEKTVSWIKVTLINNEDDED